MAPATGCTTNGFRPTGSMTQARSLHTATALRNGKVLIAGGHDRAMATLATAELYDLVTGAFTATGSMTTGRVAAEATRLGNGKVLMVGGQDASGAAIASAELYDPISGRFTATGSLLTPRLNPTVTLLQDGRVLVAGGYEGTSHGTPLATAELYQPRSGRFVATGSMHTARRNATATRLNDGTVLVAGGYNGDAVNAPERYNPRSGRFTSTAPMATPRRYPSASLLSNGAVLIAGGLATANGDAQSSSERFVQLRSRRLGSGEGSFVASGNLHTARARHTATDLGRGKFLIAGGTDGKTPIASAEMFDAARQSFTEIEPMLTARYRHTATPLANGTVLIAGGADASGALASAELFYRPPIWL